MAESKYPKIVENNLKQSLNNSNDEYESTNLSLINDNEIESSSESNSDNTSLTESECESESNSDYYTESEDEAIRCGKCWATHWWSNKPKVCRHCNTPLLWDEPPSPPLSPKK